MSKHTSLWPLRRFKCISCFALSPFQNSKNESFKTHGIFSLEIKRENIFMTIQMQIHEKALEVVGRFKRAESDLIEILQQADEHRVYLSFECKNLHEYTMRVLKLTESVAFNFIVVARKAKEVPQLKEVIDSGALSVSKARRITPVLTKTNHEQLLQKA